jgi:hypothetical protein
MTLSRRACIRLVSVTAHAHAAAAVDQAVALSVEGIEHAVRT